MLTNLRNFRSLLRSHGAHWLLYRLTYALRRRSGLLRRQMPAYAWQDRPLDTWLKHDIPSQPEAYARWRREQAPAFFFTPLPAGGGEAQVAGDVPWDPRAAIGDAERILQGELKYFAHEWLETGFPPDWHRDPVSGRRVAQDKHWSAISDDGDVDIKFIWEASRFGMVYTLARAYGFGHDERFAQAFWTMLESWAASNPPNTGPNWMDGQEAALRLLAWLFGFYAFSESAATTPERAARFTVMVAAHAERIHRNIDYAISTHSNHTISEAFGLWLVGLLFPELKDAERYFALGRKILEQEAAEQIFPDGAYSMHSLNYHRFVLHLYLAMMRLAEVHNSPISPLVSDRVSASMEFLVSLIDPETGNMPLYGSNDGALVLPLNNCDFTDYRPLLQLGWYATKGELLFTPGEWDEDLFWVYGPGSLSASRADVRQREKKARFSFPDGGIYILQSAHSKAVIHCTNWTKAGCRPTHADQFHVDLWMHGVNLACDAGTYLYSGKGPWRNGLAHTAVHNTVTVDHQDQMRMLTRFTWTDRSEGRTIQHTEERWQGEHDGYFRLPDPVYHQRTVLSLGEDRWLVVDRLDGRQPHHYSLHWLLGDFPYEQQGNSILLSVAGVWVRMELGVLDGEAAFSLLRGDGTSSRGWRSPYYGKKEPALSVMLDVDQPRACFWTFFGFKEDRSWIEDGIFRLRLPEREASVDLQSLSISDVQQAA
jgi:hypothetical protein